VTARSPFGTEFRTFNKNGRPDLDPTFSPISGEETIAQAVLRSWFQPNNSLPDLPGEGEDIREFAEMRVSATSRARARNRLAVQATRDQRVAKCEVAIELVVDELQITGRITPRNGQPFTLVTNDMGRLISLKGS